MSTQAHHEALARLDDSEEDRLERRLKIALAREFPDLTREGQKGPGDSPASAARKQVLKEALDEILAVSREGIRVASHAESRSLESLLKASGAKLPTEFEVDRRDLHYRFYLVELAFSILLEEDQYPTKADFGLVIADDNAVPARGARPVRLFPGVKDVTLFAADVQGAIGIDASLNVSVPQAGDILQSFTKANTDASLKAGFVIGPLAFQFRKAALEVTGESDTHVQWRYNLRSELQGRNDFKSYLILKVAAETRHLSLRAAVRVVPCKAKWLFFREVLPELVSAATLDVELVAGPSKSK